MPATARNRVDLPLPEGPDTSTDSPGAIRRDASSTSTRPSGSARVTPSSARSGASRRRRARARRPFRRRAPRRFHGGLEADEPLHRGPPLGDVRVRSTIQDSAPCTWEKAVAVWVRPPSGMAPLK
jgi:hypothetical protein